MVIKVDTTLEQEKLDTIVDRAKGLTSRVDQLGHRIDAFAALVDKVTNAMDHYIAEAHRDNTLLKPIRKEIVSLHHDKSAAIAKDYEHSTSELGDISNQVVLVAEHFRNSCEQVYAALDRHRNLFQQIGDQFGHSQVETRGHMDDTRHALTERTSNAAHGFDNDVHPAMASHGAVIDEIHGALESLGSQLHGSLEQHHAETESDFQHSLATPLEQHCTETVSSLAAVGTQDIDGDLHTLGEHSLHRLNEDVHSPLEAHVEHFGAVLLAAAESLSGARGSHDDAHRALQPAFSQIEAIQPPVHDAISSASRVAAAVGVNT